NHSAFRLTKFQVARFLFFFRPNTPFGIRGVSTPRSFAIGACLVNAVVAMGRRNTQHGPNLQRKQRLTPLARVRSTGTLPWLGFDRVQPNRSALPGKHCRINALDGVASTV